MRTLLAETWTGARCADPDADRDMWTCGQHDVQAWARHQCLKHCPALRQCYAVASTTTPDLRSGVVLGGVIYTEKGQPYVYQPFIGSCGECRENAAERAREGVR